MMVVLTDPFEGMGGRRSETIMYWAVAHYIQFKGYTEKTKVRENHVGLLVVLVCITIKKINFVALFYRLLNDYLSLEIASSLIA